MSGLKLILFGYPRIELNEKSVEINLRKALALLIYLAVTRQPHGREALATLLWPESDQQESRARLRRTLYRLNQVLGNKVLLATPETIRMNPQIRLWLDVDAFKTHVEACLGASHMLNAPQPECMARLGEAASLYSGDFLAGFTLPDCRDFDEWQFFQADGLRQSMAGVLQVLMDWYEAQEMLDAAIEYGRKWLALDPFHESAHRHLIKLYALAGQQAAALRQYEVCRQLLEVEIGLPPEEETIQLYEAIKSRRVSPLPESVGKPVVKGEAMLSHPPSPLIHEFLSVPHNLPAATTPFFGREKELTILDNFLANPEVRLVTLNGPGGMGKTRLAIALAEKQLAIRPARFPDGVFLVSLAALDSAERILPAIAEVLNVTLVSKGKVYRTPLQQLQDYLRPKQLLLLLDSFEHLLPGAIVVSDLLHTAPRLKVLATSREKLYLTEEHLLALRGLDFPARMPRGRGFSSEATAGYPAVQLFLQSAQRVQHTFSIEQNSADVVEICRQVEGMPLAIELAASWTEALSPTDIRTEIQKGLNILESGAVNLPVRQRSIRAVFDSTWQRLDQQEQEVLARLSVFHNGFTHEAAERVAFTHDWIPASLRMLSRLTDKCLVQYHPSQDRYHIHELLRQYTGEILGHSPDELERVRDLHRAFYTDFLFQRADDLTGVRQQAATREIAGEWENIRQAWLRAVDQANYPDIQKAYFALYQYCDSQSLYQEGASAFEKAVKSLEGGEEDNQKALVLAQLLIFMGAQYVRLGRLGDAKTALGKGQAIYDELGVEPPPGFGTDPAVESSLLANVLGNFKEAEGLGEIARKRNELRGDLLNLQLAFYALTNAVFAQGRYEEARGHAQLAYHLTEKTGNNWFKSYTLIQLGDIARVLGDFSQAISNYRACFVIRQSFNDPEGMALALNHLAEVALLQGIYPKARRYYSKSQAIYEQINDKGGLATSLLGQGYTALALGKPRKASNYFAQALEIAADMQYMKLALSIFIGVGLLFLQTKSEERGLELLDLVECYPASDQETRSKAAGILANYRGLVPSEVIASTSLRRAEIDLETTIREVHAELLDFQINTHGMASSVLRTDNPSQPPF